MRIMTKSDFTQAQVMQDLQDRRAAIQQAVYKGVQANGFAVPYGT